MPVTNVDCPTLAAGIAQIKIAIANEENALSGYAPDSDPNSSYQAILGVIQNLQSQLTTYEGIYAQYCQSVPAPPGGGGGGTVGNVTVNIDVSAISNALMGLITAVNAGLGAIDRDTNATAGGPLGVILGRIGDAILGTADWQEDPTKQGIAGLVQTLQAWALFDTQHRGGVTGVQTAPDWSALIAFLEDPTQRGFAGLVQTLQAYFLRQVDPNVPGVAQIAASLNTLVTTLVNPDAGATGKMSISLDKLVTILEPLSTPMSEIPGIEHWLRSNIRNSDTVDTIASALRAPENPTWINWLKRLAVEVARNTVMAAGYLLEPLEAGAKVLGQEIVNATITELNRLGPAKPDDILSRCLDVFAVQLGLGTRAHLISLSAEILPFTKHMGFPELAAYLADMGNFAQIAKATTGSQIEAAIVIPSGHAARSIHTPSRPTPAQLAEMTRKHIIDLNTAAQELLFQGYSNEWRDHLIESFWTQPRLRDLALALEDVSIDPAWIMQKVKLEGYHEADFDHIQSSLVQRSTKTARSYLVTAALDAFIEGVMDPGTLNGVFETAGYSQLARGFYIQGAQIKASTAKRKDLETIYKAEVAGKTMTIEDYQVNLTAIGYNADHVAVDVLAASVKLGVAAVKAEDAKAAAAMRKAQSLLIPQYKNLLKLGVIDQTTFINALEQLGITPATTTALAALENLQRTLTIQELNNKTFVQIETKIVNDNMAALKAQVLAGAIDLTQYEDSLIALGIQPAIVTPLVTEARVKITKPGTVKTPVPAQAATAKLLSERKTYLTDLYKAGLIDEQSFYNGLVDSGEAPDVAQTIVDDAQLKYAVKAAGKAGLQGAFSPFTPG